MPAEEEISNERFAAGDERISEHIPWPGLELAGFQQRAKFISTLGTNLQVVEENDGLSVEQKACAHLRRPIEQIVDKPDESLPKAREWEIPLAVPVGVRNDVDAISHVIK